MSLTDRTGGSDEGDGMDLDELEVDCLSRGGSPPPMNPYRPTTPSSPSFHPYYRRTPRRMHGEEGEVHEDVDIAGTCFDPTGGFLYVATTGGVAEWSVRDSGKRWWGSGQWV